MIVYIRNGMIWQESATVMAIQEHKTHKPTHRMREKTIAK